MRGRVRIATCSEMNANMLQIMIKGLPIYHMYDVDVHFGHESICMYRICLYVELLSVLVQASPEFGYPLQLHES